jgi:DNA repair protein RecO
LSIALSLVELYAAVIPMEQPQPEAYDLLDQSLKSIETHAKPLVALLWSQVALLNMEGFLPQFGQCAVTDRPVAGGDPFLSPKAGGYVCEEAAIAFADRFQVRAEVLYGLNRLPELEAPPGNLKFAEQTFLALQPFWRFIAETSLPANDSITGELLRSTTEDR